MTQVLHGLHDSRIMLDQMIHLMLHDGSLCFEACFFLDIWCLTGCPLSCGRVSFLSNLYRAVQSEQLIT